MFRLTISNRTPSGPVIAETQVFSTYALAEAGLTLWTEERGLSHDETSESYSYRTFAIIDMTTWNQVGSARITNLSVSEPEHVTY